MNSNPLLSLSWQKLLRSVARLALVGVIASAVYAGPPLICHPYTIGSARSLPGSDGDWKGVNPNYDRTHLVRDTLALLTPETTVIVRMETLRRAALYATAGLRGWSEKSGFTTEDRANTTALLEKLRARTKSATGPALALAWFDAGFFTETLRQTGIDRSLNGYDELVKALELRGSDPEMEFALALATAYPRHKDHATHLERARAGAKPGSLLASNLQSHFNRS